MSFKDWNTRNELLNSFQCAIEKRTGGRLTDLSVEIVEEGIVIEGRSSTYHAVQLALAAIHLLTAEFPGITSTTLVARVNGHSLVLRIPRASPTASFPETREGSSIVPVPSCPGDEPTPFAQLPNRRPSLHRPRELTAIV